MTYFLPNNNKNKPLTVSECANTIDQPSEGYLNKKDFITINFGDYFISNNNENIEPQTAGLVVDYLTRYKLTKNKRKAFEIPLKGVDNLLGYYSYDQDFLYIFWEKILNLLENINLNLDDEAIISACKLTKYGKAYRNPPSKFKETDNIKPNEKTIKQIRRLVNRSLNIFKEFGNIIDVGFDFNQFFEK